MLTGKGGVGRTSVAAAMALAAAKQGKKVLIAEVGEPDVDFSPLAPFLVGIRFPKSLSRSLRVFRV